jgi:hypothetical protein
MAGKRTRGGGPIEDLTCSKDEDPVQVSGIIGAEV